jgi:hypothetical protein
MIQKSDHIHMLPLLSYIKQKRSKQFRIPRTPQNHYLHGKHSRLKLAHKVHRGDYEKQCTQFQHKQPRPLLPGGKHGMKKNSTLPKRGVWL